MSWRLHVDHPERGVSSRSFAVPAKVWHRLELLVVELESQGWVAAELETIRYGERWVQRLARDSREMLLHIEQADADGPLPSSRPERRPSWWQTT